VFQGGSVYWSPAWGAHFVASALAGPWAAQGWETGPMGYPVTDSACGLTEGGCFQHFQGGSVYSTWAGGTHEVEGPIRQWWAAHVWETGPAGYPSSDETCGLAGGGCTQRFGNGLIAWSPAAALGAHLLTTRGADAWAAEGGPAGRLGYPVADCVVDGSIGDTCVFQGGYIDSDYSTGRHSTYYYQ
jgi:uncharacterized protein with LGFP repeats